MRSKPWMIIWNNNIWHLRTSAAALNGESVALTGEEKMKEISITWSIDDVLSVRPNLSKEQASDVLMHLKKHHDATVGINWDVIEITADELF